MNKRRKSTLFFILTILFLIVTPLILFYSQGYRINFERKKITQTGAFYFKVLPKGAEIYLNGKLKKKTDFFFGAAFIDNLLPKKYQVEIKKEGYLPWKKTLEIREKKVTDAKSIVLFPENLNFNILTKEVKDFFFSPDERKLILLTESQKTEQKKSWSLKIYDLEKNIQSQLIEEKDILDFFKYKKISGINFLDLKFSPDSKKILIKTEKEGKLPELKYLILDLQNFPPSLISLDFLGSGIENISFLPEDSNKIFFTKLINEKEKDSAKVSLFEADYQQKKVSQFPFGEPLSYTSLKGDIFWLSSNGYLFKNQEKINLEPLAIQKEATFQIYLKEPRIFLKENDLLYLLDPDEKIFKKIGEKIKNLKFSPDSKKMLYFSNSEIWVLFLEKILSQPPKENGERLFIARFSKEIGQVFWLNSHYLIFNVGNQIKAAEIDERDKINIFDFGEFKNPKIFFNKGDQKLYILSEDNLFVSKKLF